MRNPKCEAGTALAKNDKIMVTRLDVTDKESIQTAVKEGIDKFGGLDVVVNNAGYGLAGPMELGTKEQIEHQFMTNTYGPIFVMQAVLPHFRKKKSGIIINVTSVGGKITLPFNSLYHGSKFAMEGISEGANLELNPLGIRVKILEPGGVTTDFGGRSLKMTQSDTIKDYDQMIQRAMGAFAKRGEGFSTAEQIADVIWQAATDGKDQLRYVAGEDAKGMFEMRKNCSDEEYVKTMIKQFNLLGDANGDSQQ